MQLRNTNPADLFNETINQSRKTNVQPGYLHLSFRSGLLVSSDGKLKADKRKGQVAFIESEDSFTAVQWYERIPTDEQTFTVSEKPEVEQLVFESEAKLEWLNQKNRILRLSFQDEPDRNLFFWLQEPDTKYDEQLLVRSNNILSRETVADSSTATVTGEGAATPRHAGSTNVPDISWLLQALQQQSIGFQHILTPEVVKRAVSQPGVSRRLLSFLPDGLQTQEELAEVATTPQFWQQIRAFSEAVQRGSIDARQFGITPTTPGVKGFIEALQLHVDKSRQEQKGMWKLLDDGQSEQVQEPPSSNARDDTKSGPMDES